MIKFFEPFFRKFSSCKQQNLKLKALADYLSTRAEINKVSFLNGGYPEPDSVIATENFLSIKKNYRLLKDFAIDTDQIPFWIFLESGKSPAELEGLLKAHGIDSICGYFDKHSSLAIAGKYARPKQQSDNLPSVLAIVSVYNEADVIEQTIRFWIDNQVSVHVLDNWSNDGSFELVKSLAEKYANISYERFPEKSGNEYNFTEFLLRKQEINRQFKYDWYLHTDADEIRIGPWKNTNFRQSVAIVDSLGFNAIDFTVADFRPVEDGFNSSARLDDFFSFFEFGTRPGHFMQVKAWKAHDDLNLVDNAGHDASFKGRKVFPLKFFLKHYPLRSKEQAQTKIFQNRLPRVEKAMKEKGWHSHYNLQKELKNFIWDRAGLHEFGDDFYEKFFIERLTGIGIVKD